MQQGIGLDPNQFVENGDGTVSYRALGGQSVRIPASYFTSGMYQKDMQQYGQIMGPSGIFQAGSTYQPGSAGAFTGDATGGADQSLYMQNDQGQVIGYTAQEQARRDAIDKAYQALASGSGGTTSFDTPGQPPKQLGSDVFSALANGGLWMPAGSDVSGRNQNIEARIGQNGEIVVRDPRGGDGQNPVYIYDQNGNYLRSEVGSKVMSPAMGVASVGLSALGFGALGAAAGGASSGAGFVGEGALSGVPEWDAALSASQAAGGAAGTAGMANPFLEQPYELTPGSTPLDFSSELSNPFLEQPFELTPGSTPLDFPQIPPGVPPGTSPSAPSTSGLPQITNPLTGKPFDVTSLLGPATTALGGLSGSQTPTAGSGAGGVLDPRLEPYLYGPSGLMPQTQGLLNSQMPAAQAQSAQLAQVGTGLLNQPIAGNGATSGAVTLNAPTTATNPYLSGMADDISRRTQDTLGQSFNTIRGNSVGVGGLGGSRQGVAEGSAIKGAADSLQGNLANLYGTQYSNDQNRALQQYTADQSFFTNNRQQDLAGAQLGGSLLGQSQTQAWAPLTNASGIFKPYSGLTSSSDSGTNWSGLLGGALSGAALAGKLGLWS